MTKRVNINETEPQAIKAMYALEGYLQTSKLTKTHKELLKIRASQINGCAFCINMHTKDALKNGETAQRIFLLDAWRESGLFTEEEKVILAMTEEITSIGHKGLTDATYQKAEQIFDKNYISQLIVAIAIINTWNRIAISTNQEIAD